MNHKWCNRYFNLKIENEEANLNHETIYQLLLESYLIINFLHLFVFCMLLYKQTNNYQVS